MASARKRKANFRYSDEEYVLVRFTEDGVFDICKAADLTSIDDNLSAPYHGSHYPATIMRKSDDKSALLKIKCALEKPFQSKPKQKNVNTNKSKKKSDETSEKKKKLGKEQSDKTSDKKKKQGKEKSDEKEKAKEVRTSRVEGLLQKMTTDDRFDIDILQATSNLLNNRDEDIQILTGGIQPSCDVSCLSSSIPAPHGSPITHNTLTSNQPSSTASAAQLQQAHTSTARLSTPNDRSALTPLYDLPPYHTSTPRRKPLASSHDHTPAPPTYMTQPVNDQAWEDDLFEAYDYGDENDDDENMTLMNSISYAQPIQKACHEKRPPPQRPTGSKRPSPRPPQRSTTGGKRPRAVPVTDVDADQLVCSTCDKLKIENQHLKQQINEIINNKVHAAPRPGIVHPLIASKYQMVLLSPGSGVYLYPHATAEAKKKASGTACAARLLNSFYTNEELKGKNIKKSDKVNGLDERIIESIVAYTSRQFPMKESIIRHGLRMKLQNLMPAELRPKNIK